MVTEPVGGKAELTNGKSRDSAANKYTFSRKSTLDAEASPFSKAP